MFSHQSLLLLLLIVLYLLTASCTPHTENNGKPIIQKMPELFAQDTPDAISQDGYEIWTPESLANRKKSDQSEAQNERKVPRVKAPKSVVSLVEAGDIQETMKSMSSSKENSFRLPLKRASLPLSRNFFNRGVVLVVEEKYHIIDAYRNRVNEK